MATSLITIGRTGLAASRAALELTAQNIANASNADYTRRRIDQSELVTTGRIDRLQRSTLNGVTIGNVDRLGNEFTQRQVRASTSDLARIEAEIAGLRGAESALEQSGLYESLVDFEAALTLLESDPTDSALRTAAVESARQMAETFQFADFALGNARDLAEAELGAGIDKINGTASALARINLDLVGAREGTAGRAALLDARDAALRDLSQEIGIEVSFDQFGAAEVRLAVPGSPVLVSAASASTMSADITPGGPVEIRIDGAAVSPAGGNVAGRVAALADYTQRQSELDAAAAATIARANTAQAAGAALDGSPGQPLFSGTRASDITMVLGGGAGLAVAPAGSPAGSRDTGNLANLIAAFGADDGPIAGIDRTLLSLSSRIAGLDTTRDGLAIIRDSAVATMLAESGVDLDTEAANLVRLQQAFDANSRVIQVATELFDTILGLG